MNKKQFLLELSQYISFFTAEERAIVMEEYTAKFDEAGESGEAALILSLGTPMMIAIGLKRRKEAGEPLTDRQSAPVSEAASSDMTDESDSAPSPDDDADAEPVLEVAEEPEDDAFEEEEPERRKKAPEKKPRAKAGAVISCVFISIITIIAALCVMCVGVYFIIVMGNLLVVALQNLSLLTDALLLLAGALVSGGIGLVITWLGLWAAIRVISGQVKRVNSSREADPYR